MKLTCTTCKMPIDSANVNVVTDLAKCERCGAIHKVSSLVPAMDDKALAAPPAGSKIEMRKGVGDGFQVSMPKRGFAIENIALLAFALFWLGFIAFATSMVQNGEDVLLTILFTIPFWIVGFVVLAMAINGIYGTQTIEATKSTLTLVKSRPIYTRRHEYNLKDIQSIRLADKAVQRGSKGHRSTWIVKTPAIIVGSGTKYFFETANDAEKEWVTAFLEAFRLAQR